MTTRASKRKSGGRALEIARRTLALEAELREVVSIDEYRAFAIDSMDPPAFDYVDGGASDEVSLAENQSAWLRYRLRPRVLVDVSRVDPATTLLGSQVAFPVAIAPMAAHGLAHPAGEVATARAAAVAGVPFTLSTVSTRSIEEVAEAAPDGVRWFQLYTQSDSGRNRSLVERAAAAGYGAIVLTVDVPVLGYRERDRQNEFELAGPFGNFADAAGGPDHANHGVIDDIRSADQTWDDLATIRSWSKLPLVLKGIMTAEDARLAVDSGADAIVVSNHGARQLDRVAAAIDVLEEIVEAVGGRTEVWVDGGVRRGLDIAIAVALGARGVLVGRPIMYALAAGGQPAVERAVAILREEFEVTLSLLGAPTTSAIRREHVAR
jgi:isopentenyl diphosphate isomerase/L-lactate dehydrogenase-like FMN-dependent dehydrogenase